MADKKKKAVTVIPYTVSAYQCLLRRIGEVLDSVEELHGNDCDQAYCCSYIKENKIPAEFWNWWEQEKLNIVEEKKAEEIQLQLLKNAALAKLTEEDKRVLGLIK